MKYNFLVDSHCHLNFPEFSNDFAEILARAKHNKVKYMLNISTNLNDFPQVLAIANQNDHIYATIGVHPCHVEDHPEVSVEQLFGLITPKIIGIGETGLDYFHQPFDKAKQQRNLLTHIELAQITGLPIIIHTRDAQDDTIKIITKQMEHKPFKGLIHCFTGTAKLRDAMLELGFKISISGIVTFRNALLLQEVVKAIPIESLLVETDAPYLAPTPMRGKRNEPSFTLYTAEFLANLKSITFEQIMHHSTANFCNLFDVELA